MEFSKIFIIICSFILIVCLTLCISTLVVLRNSIAENEAVQDSAIELVSNLDQCISTMNQNMSTAVDQDSMQTNKEKPVITADRFCVKETNGKIGIYTVDGTLLKVLDISVDALPQADRELLKNGITIGSWKELISLIQDYTD